MLGFGLSVLRWLWSGVSASDRGVLTVAVAGVPGIGASIE